MAIIHSKNTPKPEAQAEQSVRPPLPLILPATPAENKRRGIGTGYIKQMADGQWRATITTEIYSVIDDDGVKRMRRHTKSKLYPSRTAAERGIQDLQREHETENAASLSKQTTLSEIYEAWEEWFVRFKRSKKTTDCYRSAYLHLASLYQEPIGEITIEQLQDCIDSCPRGKRTRENMKALLGLLYKYAIPRKMANVNLATYLVLTYDKKTENIPRQSLTDEEISRIFDLAKDDEDARDVCCLIYLGLRPSEFLGLKVENVDLKQGYIVGGIKTEAGIDRVVTISPRILDFMSMRIGFRTEGYVFGNPDRKYSRRDLKRWSEGPFRQVLERANIDNPLVPAGGKTLRHRITPHNCRHTFARMVKKIDAPVEDKMALIGHANEDQLRDYIDSTLPELKRVTDQLM